MKINNSFHDEFRTPKSMAEKKLKQLKLKKHNTQIALISFSAIIFILNIVVLTMATIGLVKVINEYNDAPDGLNFGLQVLPTILVSVVSISIFVLSIVILIYQGTMKSKNYLVASENIQYLTIKYLEGKMKISEVEFKAKIEKIYQAAIAEKKKVSFSKTIITIMTGGINE